MRRGPGANTVTTNVGTRAVRTGRSRVSSSNVTRCASTSSTEDQSTASAWCCSTVPGALARVTATAGRGRSRTRPAHREFRCCGTTDRGWRGELELGPWAPTRRSVCAHRILRLRQLVGQATQSCRVSRGHAPTGSGVRSILCERGWLTIRQRLHHHARVEVAPVVRAPVPKRFSRWPPSNQS